MNVRKLWASLVAVILLGSGPARAQSTPNASIHAESGVLTPTSAPASPVGSFDALTNSSSASPTGAFVTSLPVDVPAFRGLEPRLSITYNSTGSSGELGAGWGLSGYSAVTRGARVGGVASYAMPTFGSTDDAKDTYYLDGAELIPCSRMATGGESPSCTYPAASGQYRYYFTKIESYARIAYDPSQDVWIVWAKNGTRHDYALPWKSPVRGTARWLLTRSTDLSANEVDYSYTADQTTNAAPSADYWYPSLIQYGHYRVSFNWETRVDWRTEAIGDGLAIERQRLKSIDVMASPGRVRAYALEYTNSPSSLESLLQQVQEFGSDAELDALGNVTNRDGATSWPPTHFGYESTFSPPPPIEGVSTFPPPAAPAPTPTFEGAPYQIVPTFVPYGPTVDEYQFQQLSLDVNGDGLMDHVVVYSGFSVGNCRCSDWLGYEVCAFFPDCNSGDPNLCHSFCQDALAVSFRMVTFLAQPGGGFRALSPFDTGVFDPYGVSEFRVADVNGDHKDDIVLLQWRTNGAYDVYPNDPHPYGHESVQSLIFDERSETYTQTADDDSFGWHNEIQLSGNNSYKARTLVVDVTGDGLADLVQPAIVSANGYHWEIRTAVGRGDGTFVDLGVTFPLTFAVPDGPIDAQWHIGDWNGDGRADLLFTDGDPAQPDKAIACRVMSATPARAEFGSTPYVASCNQVGVDLNIPWRPDTDFWLPADVNGDGRVDVARVFPGTGGLISVQALLSIDSGFVAGQQSATSVAWAAILVGERSDALPWGVGDVDGDGRADLELVVQSGDVSSDAAALVVVHTKPVPGTNDVQFAAQVVDPGFPFPHPTQPWGNATVPTYSAVDYADHDGDGRMDVIAWPAPFLPLESDGTPCVESQSHQCVYHKAVLTPYVKLADPTPVDAEQWQAADLDGDGLTDYVHAAGVHTGGVLVEARLRTAQGTWQSAIPTVHFASIAGIRARDVRFGDIDGDGRADAIIAHHPAPGQPLAILTLKSLGDGTFQEEEADFTVTGFLGDSNAWRTLDVDGDGKTDLVHLWYSEGQFCVGRLSLHIDGFISSGDGTFVRRDMNGQDICYAQPGNPAWHVADVNHDGKADLVSVWPSSQGFVIDSLIYDATGGAGDGGWRFVERANTAVSHDYDNAWRWLVTDMNGDGAADLAYVTTRIDAGGGYDLFVDEFLGDGNGQWTGASTYLQGGFTTADGAGWKPGDVNGDGKTDLVHVQAVGTTSLTTQIDTLVVDAQSNPHLVVLDIGERSLASAPIDVDARSWNLANLDLDAATDLEHLTYDTQSGVNRVESVERTVEANILTEIVNPLGGSQRIAYTTLRSATAPNDPQRGCLLPPGGTRRLVSSSQTIPGETTTYSYECPGWSAGERSLLGWQKVTATAAAAINRPGSITTSTYALTDSCHAFLTDKTTIDGGGTLAAVEQTTQPVAPLMAPPYRCEPWKTYVTETDTMGAAMTRGTEMQYDDFGEREWLLDDGDEAVQGDERTTHAEVHVNGSIYLVTPMRSTLLSGLGSAGVVASEVEYEYDSRGLDRSTSSWNDVEQAWNVTQYNYDSYGNRTLTTDAAGHQTAMTYDNLAHLFPLTMTNAVGLVTTKTWDMQLGLETGKTDANGHLVEWRSYDALSRLGATGTADGGITTYEYSLVPGPLQITERIVDGTPDGLWTRYLLDEQGRVESVVSEGDGTTAASVAKDYEYSDASPRVWRASHAHDAATSPSAIEEWAYDFRGRPTSVTHPDGTSGTAQYLAGETDSWDEVGHTHTEVHDAYQRLTAAMTMTYGYDVADRQIWAQDANGNRVETDWDTEGHKVTVRDPDMGTSTYTYDAVGNQTIRTDARGITQTTVYDAIGRPTSRTNNTNLHAITLHYDENTSANGLGQLTSVEDSNQVGCTLSDRYDYDLMGRVETRTKCVDSLTEVVTTRFDNIGRLREVDYPDGEIVPYQYDAAGRLSAVTGYASLLRYDVGGHLVSSTMANGTTEGFEYSPDRDFYLGTSVTSSTNVLYYWSNHQYYADGLVQSSDDATEYVGYVDNGVTYEESSEHRGYDYDNLHRLSDTTGDLPESFQYDAIGNMTSNQALGTYGYQGSGPHAVASIGKVQLSYDAVGNMTAAGSLLSQHKYTWDENSLLTSSIFYTKTPGPRGLWKESWHIDTTYDAEGERVLTIDTGGGHTRFFGPYVEVSPSSQLVKYVYAGPRMIARHVDQNAPITYHQDRLGSTRFVTDAAGSPLTNSNYQFTSFGHLLRGDASLAGDYLFTGQRQGPDASGPTGGELVYLHARYYDPSLGRFLSADSMIPTLHSPEAWNRYSYAYNNPISNVDPTGHTTESYQGKEAGDASLDRSQTDLDRWLKDHPNTWNIPNLSLSPWVWKVGLGVAAVGVAVAILSSVELVPVLVAAQQLAPTIMRVGGAIAGAQAIMPYIPALVQDLPRPGLCFIAGTDVVMADGTLKAIEDVRPGDRVLTEGGENGARSDGEVTRTFTNATYRVVHIEIDDGDGGLEGELQATGKHPFWVEGTGWKNAEDLTRGDPLRDVAGRLVLVSNRWEESRDVETYNIAVKDSHTYYVNAGGLTALVHNQDDPFFAPTAYDHLAHIVDLWGKTASFETAAIGWTKDGDLVAFKSGENAWTARQIAYMNEWNITPHPPGGDHAEGMWFQQYYGGVMSGRLPAVSRAFCNNCLEDMTNMLANAMRCD